MADEFEKNLNFQEKIFQTLIETNKRQVQFQKNLGLSAEEALKLSTELGKAADLSGNIATNSIAAAKALGGLNKELGIGTSLLAKQAIEIGRFARTLDLSVKSQANLAKTSVQTGRSVKNQLLSQVGVVKGVEAELGTRLDIQGVLNEANSISGQIRSQLQANPETLAKTVAVAKELGFELEAIAGTSKALLDFQSSIEAELEAELLTGRQLNLEQARLFALTGDIEGLTREIAANVGDFNDFSKLNVLQQDAIAKSVGMTSDQLADQLFNQATITELKEKARAEGDAETLRTLEQLDVQQRLAIIIEKIQASFVSIASALEPVFIGFEFLTANSARFLGTLAGIATLSGILKKNFIGKAVAQIFGSSVSTMGPLGIAAAAAGVGIMTGLITKAATSVDDVVIPPGGASFISGPAGTFKLNNADSVVAGTNLGGAQRSTEEIVTMAASAATRAISVDFNSVKFNSANSVDAVFA
jgi:hypothetical protein